MFVSKISVIFAIIFVVDMSILLVIWFWSTLLYNRIDMFFYIKNNSDDSNFIRFHLSVFTDFLLPSTLYIIEPIKK